MAMRDYEERQRARKERYEQRALQLHSEASGLDSRARAMARDIPLGQPILVGHHSEAGDRRYRARIQDAWEKSYAASQKAAWYERKAQSVGAGGISSDDPGAVEKLKAKLATLEKDQEMMKQANALIRRNKTEEARLAALVEMGMEKAEAWRLLHPLYGMRQGFEPFELQNNNANIRRVRLRILQLEKAASENVTNEVKGSGFTLREDAEENRIMFIFDDKPEPEIRTMLKSWGFRWSPGRGAWVRMLNANGRHAANRVMEKLNGQG